MLRIYVYFRKKEINKNMDDNISELFEKFLLIESHSTLFQLAINNIRIWQYIRYSLLINYCKKYQEQITSGIMEDI